MTVEAEIGGDVQEETLMMGYGWGAGLGGSLWMVGVLILFIGIVFLVTWAIHGFGQSADRRTDASPRPEPMDILRERFARGEITETEFEQMRRTLGYDR